MSAFALLGDFARHCPNALLSHENYLVCLLKELVTSIYNPMHASVCNNAVWAMGEIALQCSKRQSGAAVLQPYVKEVVQSLIPLLMGNNGGVVIPGIAENAACCMGRLAKVDVNFILRDLPRFFSGW